MRQTLRPTLSIRCTIFKANLQGEIFDWAWCYSSDVIKACDKLLISFLSLAGWSGLLRCSSVTVWSPPIGRPEIFWFGSCVIMFLNLKFWMGTHRKLYKKHNKLENNLVARFARNLNYKLVKIMAGQWRRFLLGSFLPSFLAERLPKMPKDRSIKFRKAFNKLSQDARTLSCSPRRR